MGTIFAQVHLRIRTHVITLSAWWVSVFRHGLIVVRQKKEVVADLARALAVLVQWLVQAHVRLGMPLVAFGTDSLWVRRRELSHKCHLKRLDPFRKFGVPIGRKRIVRTHLPVRGAAPLRYRARVDSDDRALHRISLPRRSPPLSTVVSQSAGGAAIVSADDGGSCEAPAPGVHCFGAAGSSICVEPRGDERLN